MKITFINQYYKPLNNPPAKRLSAFAEYFVKKNWDVKVITGQPNYPTGKLMKRYNWFWKKEKINNVIVYRFPEIPLKNEGVIKRLINYLSFTFSSLFSFPIISKTDIVFISSPPLFSAIPLFYISKLFKKKIIFDIRDLWPESAAGVLDAKKGFFYKIFAGIVNDMYKKSDLIFAVTGEMEKNLLDRKLGNVKLITNFSKKEELSVKKKDSKKIKIVYTGIITKAQSLNLILKANLDKKVYDKFEWHIAGDGEDLESLRKFVLKNNFKNVFIYGYKDRDFCNKLIQEGDLCLASLGENEIFKMALPSKALEYLSYGKPLLISWSTEMKSILDKNDCGYFVPTVKKGFKEILLKINKKDLIKKSKNAYKLFLKRFEEDVVCKKMFEYVKGLEK